MTNIELAKNPNTSKEVLEILSKDKHEDVRCCVARNPNTSKEVLESLSKDEYYAVRYRIADNPNTSDNILKSLLKDLCCKETALNSLMKKRNLELLK